jgi:hypothetical protein
MHRTASRDACCFNCKRLDRLSTIVVRASRPQSIDEHRMITITDFAAPLAFL